MNLNQVTIYSTRVAESIEFYKKLGLRLIVDSAPRYVRFECPDGDSTLSIHQTDDISQSSNIVLYFECENLDEEVARLKLLGLDFESEPTHQTWLWREVYLIDPSGNRICLFYAGENRKNPPWRVKCNSISNFLPIHYSGFWDVPHAFYTVFENDLFLFWRDDFDEELDDYPPNYKVYLIKDSSLEEAIKNWHTPLLKNKELIGEVPTKEVRFDSTNRKFINSEVLEKLLTKEENY